MGEITFSGLASGMDTSSWIEALVNIKQKSVTTLQNRQTNLNSNKSTLDAVKSNVSALRSSIEKFTDAKFGATTDIFMKNKVTSSNSEVVTANVTSNATRQSFDIVVDRLATSTVATSSYNASINEDTLFSKLAAGSAKEGTFSVYVDGKKTEINVEKESTLGDVLQQLKDIEGVTASIEDGKFNINADAGHQVVVGSSTDESNFSSVLGLVKDSETGNYSSFNQVAAINASDNIFDTFGEEAMGTFVIGNQEFTIDENTTFKSLINTINGKSDSGVSASWDSANGSLVLKAKTEGAFNINIEAGTSNLTSILGFTSSEKDANGEYLKDGDGKYISNIAQNTQQLGDYAKFTINGNEIISSSNNVTTDISGIEGLTLTLKAVSAKDEDGNVKSTKIDIEQDSQGVLDAAKAFVDAYNKAISTIDSKTASGQALYGETSLTQIRNNLRRTATASVGDGDSTFRLLAEIGISTGKAENSSDTTKVNKLQIDEKKFLEALKENPDGVKALLVGDNKGEATSGGVLNKLEKITEDSLTSQTGYFDAKVKSYDKQISNLKTQISNAQLKVNSYKDRLTKQFQNMETIIASIQQSYSQLSI